MNKGKVFIGKVVANSNQKTIKVVVEDFYRHPLYKKTLRRWKKYLVHSEKEVAIGEKVRIRESRPLSRRKRFVLEEVIENQNAEIKMQNEKSVISNR